MAEVDTEVSRRSVRAIGRIAFRLPSAAQFVIEKLIEFLDMDINNVRAETLLVMKDLLRKYPDRRGDGESEGPGGPTLVDGRRRLRRLAGGL
jgi:hypothetical protein